MGGSKKTLKLVKPKLGDPKIRKPENENKETLKF